MRVVDYIADYIVRELNVSSTFLVSGGGMMFLSDAIAAEKRLSFICPHHEQAAAMAAVGYAKYTGGFGAAVVTTGCGGTNAITGLLNAWQDSAKVFFISGQCKRKQTIRHSGLNLRQFGVQEADIVGIVSPITKYAVMVEEPEAIAYHLEKARYLAENGRPGPVWIDVPMDVQGAVIDPRTLKHFSPQTSLSPDMTDKDWDCLEEALARAERPVIVAGQGIDLSGTPAFLKKLVERLQIPVVTPFLGINALPGSHPNLIGRIGTKGTRAGNYAVQNADLLLVLGSRLSVSSTGHEYEMFARKARIMVVDIDSEEHHKNTVRIDRFIHADLRAFFRRAEHLSGKDFGDWLNVCRSWRERYPVCLPEYRDDRHGINLYYFVEMLSRAAAGIAPLAVVSDAGSSFYVATQGIRIDPPQRYITSGGQAEMGFSLPAAIGAAAAAGPDSRILAITGDGSLQMNIQELQTLKHYRFPVKLFVWNNNGYLSIRATQRKFFHGNFIGTDPDSGVSFPSLEKVAAAYGLPFRRLSSAATLEEQLREVISSPEPEVVEVMCDPDQEIVPSISSIKREDGTMKSMPPEDMYPFLDWAEHCSNMIIDPLPRT